MSLTLPAVGIIMYMTIGLVSAAILNGSQVRIRLWPTVVSYVILCALLYSAGIFS
jgi:hypothetical protein